MSKDIKKILKFVATNWDNEQEYDGRMETWCYFCGQYQGDTITPRGKHEKTCLSLKARSMLKMKKVTDFGTLMQ